MPSTAHKLIDSRMADIGLDEVSIGDRLVVFPHEICPVDGAVVEGRGTMDESYLTGEPFLIAKVPGAEVLSGAVNGETALTVAATKLPIDSRYSKIMRVMQNAEANRPRIRRIADRLGAWYTAVGVAVAAAGWMIGHDPTRFLAVLVIATPCPLLLAIPVAIIGAISVAAGRGIIVKDPAMLERISSCRTVIFDKTGTLTYGRPVLTDILCAPRVDRNEVLVLAASLEQYSKHPLAGSVLEAARDAVVLETSLGKVDELIHIGRRMRAIALQSAVGGMALSMIGMALAAAGLLPPVAGAIAQEVIDLAAVLNALRVALPAKDLRDPGV